MTENNNQIVLWKKHEIEEKIGYDQFKNNKLWTGNFYFVIGADSQFGMIWPRKQRDPKDWTIEMNKAIYAVEKINNLSPRPQFVVICGDLVDAMPNIDTELNRLQVEAFQQVFSKLHPSISLVCVCGNHDVGNNPNANTINTYRSKFGQDYFSFWCGGVLFLVLNSQYFKDSSQVEEFAKMQDQWLTEKLKEHKDQRIIVFQHIPFFLNTIDEDNDYFNIEKNIRQQMLEKLYAAGVSHVFFGHYHRNCDGFYKNMELVTTCAIGAPMGEDPSGLRIVKMYDNNVIHTYFSLEQIPKSIIIKN